MNGKQRDPGEAFSWRSKDGTQLSGRHWPLANPRARVILIPGTGDHLGRFLELAEFLRQGQFEVMGADWRGNGKSEGTRGYIDSFEQLHDDLESLLQRVKPPNQRPTFLYGQSFGGLLALHFAVTKSMQGISVPLDGIVASSPALGLALRAPKWKLAIGHTLGKIFPRMNLPTGIGVEALTRDADRQKEFLSDRLRHGKICARTFFLMLEQQQWLRKHVHHLNTPSLLIHGDLDSVTAHAASLEFAESAGEICDFRSWPGLKHELHQEPERELVVQYVIQWLRQR